MSAPIVLDVVCAQELIEATSLMSDAAKLALLFSPTKHEENEAIVTVPPFTLTIPIKPDMYLRQLLASRNRSLCMRSHSELPDIHRRAPSDKQITSYDNNMLRALQHSDLLAVMALYNNGYHMNACNKFRESTLHFAARKCTPRVVKFMLDIVGSEWILDDIGRTPLHDACWRSPANFSVVMLLMDCDINMLFTVDSRGHSPLDYAHREDWSKWCAFLHVVVDKYWPQSMQENR